MFDFEAGMGRVRYIVVGENQKKKKNRTARGSRSAALMYQKLFTDAFPSVETVRWIVPSVFSLSQDVYVVPAVSSTMTWHCVVYAAYCTTMQYLRYAAYCMHMRYLCCGVDL